MVISARNSELLDDVATSCQHDALDNERPLVLPLDITNNEQLANALTKIQETLYGIDLVIINAGTYSATRANTLTTNEVSSVLETNLLGPIRACALMLPDLVKSAEKSKSPYAGVAFVGSVAGYRGLPQALTYGPGKAGLISFSESLWQDLRPMGLNVWLINPGFVKTKLTALNDFNMPALLTAQEASQEIIRGFAQGCFEIHFPKRFTRFMKFLRLIPITCYLKLSQRLVPGLTYQQFKQPAKSEKAHHAEANANRDS